MQKAGSALPPLPDTPILCGRVGFGEGCPLQAWLYTLTPAALSLLSDLGGIGFAQQVRKKIFDNRAAGAPGLGAPAADCQLFNFLYSTVGNSLSSTQAFFFDIKKSGALRAGF